MKRIKQPDLLLHSACCSIAKCSIFIRILHRVEDLTLIFCFSLQRGSQTYGLIEGAVQTNFCELRFVKQLQNGCEKSMTFEFAPLHLLRIGIGHIELCNKRLDKLYPAMFKCLIEQSQFDLQIPILPLFRSAAVVACAKIYGPQKRRSGNVFLHT